MGCGASAKKNETKADDKDKKDENGASGGKKEVDINEKFEKVEFEKLDVEEVDSIFAKSGGIFDEILGTNTRLVEGVQTVIRSETVKETGPPPEDDKDLSKNSSQVLAQRIQDALNGARLAMEDAMPDNVGDIRQKASDAKQAAEKAACANGDKKMKPEQKKTLQDDAKKKAEEVAKLVAAAVPKLKTLLPKIEGSSISFPEGIKLEKLDAPARAAMDMLIKFFDLLKEIGTTAVSSFRQKSDEIIAEIKMLPKKLQDVGKTKLEGKSIIEKGKWMKEKADLIAKNSKLVNTLKDYIDRLLKKLMAIGEILKNAFEKVMKTALQYAPGAVAMVQDAVQSVKDSAAKITDANKDDIEAAKAKGAEAAGKAKDAAGPKGTPPADAPKDEAAPAKAAEADKSAPPAAEPEQKAEPPAPAAEAAAPAAAPAAPSAEAAAPAAEAAAPAVEAAAPAVEAAAPAAEAAAKAAAPVVEASAATAESAAPAVEAAAVAAESAAPAVDSAAPASAEEKSKEPAAPAAEAAQAAEPEKKADEAATPAAEAATPIAEAPAAEAEAKPAEPAA